MPDLDFKNSLSGCIFVFAQLGCCFRSCLLGLSHPLPQVVHFLVAGPSLQAAYNSSSMHCYHAAATRAVMPHSEVTLQVKGMDPVTG